MNETIGVKGEKNDRRRVLKITKKTKEQLEEYLLLEKKEQLKELEQKVKQQQIITFLKILPIVTVGKIITTVTEKTTEEKAIDNLKSLKDHLNKSDVFHEKVTKDIVKAIDTKIALLETTKKEPTHSKENRVTPIKVQLSPNEILEIITGEEIELKTYPINNIDQNKKDEILQTKLKNLENKINKSLEKNIDQVEILEEKQDFIPLKETTIKHSEEEKLAQLKNQKIVTEYEKKLKDVRGELRSLIFDYNILTKESENLYSSKEAELLLDKLNIIIKKIETLQEKIELPDFAKYDDNYLYTLIEDSIIEFKNKQFVNEIKDSALYISIAEKLTELDEKKEYLTEKIETKKQILAVDETNFQQIRDKYFDYERFATNLLKFQNEQDQILKEINEKLANATTIEEKVQVQIVGIREQNRRLRAIIASQMMLPGARSAKGLATATMLSLYFMRNIMHPQTRTRRYKVINVEDYSREIENNLGKLEDVGTMLQKTSAQIDTIIKDFEKNYQEYFGVVPECTKLLADLEKIRSDIKEKEYELEKIKLEQQKNLENNNAKVKHYENLSYE